MSPKLSAYEEERQRNIATNNEVLRGLGLCRTEPQPPASRKRRTSPTTVTPSEPTRKSSRYAGLPRTEVDTATSSVTDTDVPRWELEAFEACEQAGGSWSGATWDVRKHHQHLVRSHSGRTIATTGVAGYGAALVRKEPGVRRWAVRAIAFGVGGFGVGVVRTSMKPPYKSIGKKTDAVGSYHSSGSFVSPGDGEKAFGPSFVPRDVIGVELRKKGAQRTDVVFSLNGKEVGIAASVDAAADALVVACQPYMGGVATLE